jgi:hypothetical protein
MISFFFKSVHDALWLPLGTDPLGLLKGMKVMVGDSSPLGLTIGRGEFWFGDGAAVLGEARRSGITLMVKASAILWNGSYLLEGGVGGAGGFSKTRCCMLFRTAAVGEAIVDLLYSTASSLGEAYEFVALVLMIYELGYRSRVSSLDRRYDERRGQQDGQEPIDVSGDVVQKKLKSCWLCFSIGRLLSYRCCREYKSTVARLF